MAIVSKTTRCAVCGSTDVTFSEATKRYHCASCGADEAHAMNAADVAAINSIAALGDTEAPPLSQPGHHQLDPREPRPDVILPPPFTKQKPAPGGAGFCFVFVFHRSTAVTGRRGWRPAGRRNPRRRAGRGSPA